MFLLVSFFLDFLKPISPKISRLSATTLLFKPEIIMDRGIFLIEYCVKIGFVLEKKLIFLGTHLFQITFDILRAIYFRNDDN